MSITLVGRYVIPVRKCIRSERKGLAWTGCRKPTLHGWLVYDVSGQCYWTGGGGRRFKKKDKVPILQNFLRS